MKKINFYAKDDLSYETMNEPKPSIKMLPQWYKKMSSHQYKNNIFRNPTTGETNLTAKRCIPFFDALSSGYMITLQSDIYAVDPTEYRNRLIWEVEFDVVSTHASWQIGDMQAPDNFEKSPYKWEGSWGIETPPGYSILITHPLNRFDLPFFTLSAIVDSDSYNIPLNIPFFLKENFYGKIEKGTPIAQIIPFKRESWNSDRKIAKIKYSFAINKLKSVIDRSYKNNFWHKKDYK